MSSPGVILLCDFVQAKDATPGKGFSGFLDYQDRPEAFSLVKTFDGDKWTVEPIARVPGTIQALDPSYSGYLEYQDRSAAKPDSLLMAAGQDPLDITARINSYFSPGDRSDGIFDPKKDRLTPEEMENYHVIYDRSQAAGCPLYRGVISFDNNFLREQGIMFNGDVEKRRLKDVTRAAVSTLIEKSHLDSLNVEWTGAIHYNTDNIHVHFSLVEKEKIQRRYDRLPMAAIDAAKSKVVNQIVGSEQSILRTKLLREDLLPATVAAYRDHSDILIRLMDQLPADVRWEYNRRGFADYRPLVDKTVDRLIFADPAARSAYEKYVETLEKHALQLRQFYGDGSRHLWEDFVPERMADFYAQAGNALLKELEKSTEIKLEDLSSDLTPNQLSAIEVGMREGIDVTAIAKQEIPASAAWDYLELQRIALPDELIREALNRNDPKLIELVTWASESGADPTPLLLNKYSDDHGMMIAIALRHDLDVSSIADPALPIEEVKYTLDLMAKAAEEKPAALEHVDFDSYLAVIATAARPKATTSAVAAVAKFNDILGKERDNQKHGASSGRNYSRTKYIPEKGEGSQKAPWRPTAIPTGSPRALHEEIHRKGSVAPTVRGQSARMTATCRTASRRLQHDYEKNLRRLQREHDQQQNEQKGR